MQDIHDIRPPVQVGIDPFLIKMVLLGLAVGLILTLFIFVIKKWLNKTRKNQDIKFLPKPLSPYDTALRDLAALSHSAAISSRLFYFDLTLVLRKYVGGSYKTHAIEMTSQQFLSSIRRLGLDENIKTGMVEFYKLCDPYKYAGVVPDTSKIKSDLALVKDLITQVENQLKADENAKKGEE